MITELLQPIQDVWHDHQSFSTEGVDYLIFLTRHDIQHMEEDNWDTQECVEEFCDIVITHILYLQEQGYTEEISELVRSEVYNLFTEQSLNSPVTARKSAKKIYQYTRQLEELESSKEQNKVIAKSICLAIQSIQELSSKTVFEEITDRLYTRMEGNVSELEESMLQQYRSQ